MIEIIAGIFYLMFLGVLIAVGLKFIMFVYFLL